MPDSSAVERQRRLSEIASFFNREPLSEDEFEFLRNNFDWDDELLKKVRKNKERPLNGYHNGFKEKCLICGIFRNYCSC